MAVLTIFEDDDSVFAAIFVKLQVADRAESTIRAGRAGLGTRDPPQRR